MAKQNPNDQDKRHGGYGDDAGTVGADVVPPGAPEREGASAVGRDNPVTGPIDADEALGNRTGGYGGNPPATSNQGDGASDAEE